MSARVRLNMKRSPLEGQDDRPKQRRVSVDPDEDEVMIGDIPVNEEVNIPGQRFQQQNTTIGNRKKMKEH